MSFASQKDFGDESARKLELFIPSTTLSELSSSHLTHTSNLASVSVMAGQQSSYVPGTKILIKDVCLFFLFVENYCYCFLFVFIYIENEQRVST